MSFLPEKPMPLFVEENLLAATSPGSSSPYTESASATCRVHCIQSFLVHDDEHCKATELFPPFFFLRKTWIPYNNTQKRAIFLPWEVVN